MLEQTFIRPVPQLIEALSKAGKTANNLSTNGQDVILTVSYLGLEICVKRCIFTQIFTQKDHISWLDLSEARYPYDIIDQTIRKTMLNLDKGMLKAIKI